jgi:hypothetical protein
VRSGSASSQRRALDLNLKTKDLKTMSHINHGAAAFIRPETMADGRRWISAAVPRRPPHQRRPVLDLTSSADTSL